jgi:hypothetical protein
VTTRGPRTIEHVDRPLQKATELPAEDGIHVLLLELGQPVPDGVDETWHHIAPIEPSVPIVLHQTDTSEPEAPRYPFTGRTPHTPSWLFTLGPFEGDPLVEAVHMHGERTLSLVLRNTREDGRVLTAQWYEAKVVADFDSATQTWWLDWTAEPINEEGHVWTNTLAPAPAQKEDPSA